MDIKAQKMERKPGKMQAIFFAALLSLFAAVSSSFAGGGENGGQVAQFMSFGAGARSLAMGRAFFAVSDDASSVYSNPAGMTQLEQKEVGFMQASLAEGAALTSVNFVHPNKKKGWVWGVNMTQLKAGGFEKITVKKDKNGEIQELQNGGDFSDSQTGYIFAFGKRVLDTLAVGMSVKQITRQLDDSADSVMTADASILASPLSNKNYTMAFGIQNIFAMQSGDTDDKLPLLVKIGNSYRGLKDKMILALDLTQNFTRSTLEWNVGAEYWVWRYVSLRAGVEGNPGLRQSSFGLGFKVKGVHLDVAEGLTDVGDSMRMGVSWKFGKSVRAKREDTARRLIQEGIAAYSQGNFLLGLDRLNRSLDLDPANNDVRNISGKLSGVVTTIPSAVGEGEVANIIRRAVLDYLRGDMQSSINSLRYAYLEKDPTNEKLLQLLNKLEKEARVKLTERADQNRVGFSYIDQKLYDALQSIYDAKYDKSIILLQEVLDLDPQNIEALKRLGSCFYLIEQKDKAKEVWQKAMELDPSDAVIQEYLQQIP